MYKDNWIKWYYDDILYNKRTIDSKTFRLEIDYNQPIRSLDIYETLCENAKLFYETHNKLTLFFSGGLNSQIILRTYLNLKIPINVVIIRYKKNYNILEVKIAEKICNDLNINFKIIDFDFDIFFENDAQSLLQKNPTHDPLKLVFLKASTSIDGCAIIGNKFPYIYRNSINYADNGEWKIKFCDEDFVFVRTGNHNLIGDWFHYSPALLISIIHTPLIKNMINDKFPGKLSVLSMRKIIFDRYFYNLFDRTTSNGFNGTLIPESGISFYDYIIKDKIIDLGSLDFKIENFKFQIFP